MVTLVLNTTAQTQDTQILKHNPASNFSGGPSLYLEAASATNQARILLKFLDLVPPGGTVSVSSATLSFRNADAVGATRGVQVRKFLQAWGYTTASWNNRDTGTPWSTAGALGGAEVDATVLATGTAPTTAGNFTVTGAGLAAYCQAVMNGGADHGLLINLLDDATSWDGISRRIVKSSNGNAFNRPTLTIEYTVGVPPTVSISSPTVDRLASTMTFVASLSAAAGSSLSVDYATQDGTALAGVDYSATSGTLTFLAGEITKDIVVPLLIP